MKSLFDKLEESWNIIFSEFDSNINKEIIVDDLESKLTKLENSWKNTIKKSKKQKNFSLQTFSLKEINEKEVSQILNYHLQRIQNQRYFKMYKEIDNFLNTNYEIIKTGDPLIWKGIECSKDFFQILFNFSNFIKSKNFDEIWYLKIIFKELYSLLDKYNMFFSISCSIRNSYNDKHFELFKLKVLDKGINKYNYIIIENYDRFSKEVSFRFMNNTALKFMEKDKTWNKVLWNRNEFEHLFLGSALEIVNLIDNVVLDDLKKYVYYLIGMNIWALTNLDQQFKTIDLSHQLQDLFN